MTNDEARDDPAGDGALDAFFRSIARQKFDFLRSLGFEEIEATEVREVRYRKEAVVVEIYQEPRSYEVNSDVVFLGKNYSLGQLIRATDEEAHRGFHYPAATTIQGLAVSLAKVSSLLERFGQEALRGDPRYFSRLDELRKLWVAKFGDKVEASQTRPKAEEAWRNGDYAKAAELYGKIRVSLSPAELKKLAYAEKQTR